MFKNKHSTKLVLGGIVLFVFIFIGVWFWTHLTHIPGDQKTDVDMKLVVEKDGAEITEQTDLQNSKFPKMGTKKINEVSTSQKRVDDVFQSLEKELNQLTVQEIIQRLEGMEPLHIRKLAEETTWFNRRLEAALPSLSNEEQIALMAADRIAYPESYEGYEEVMGDSLPPPGYYHSRSGDKLLVLKHNTPNLVIRKVEGFGRWYQLTPEEYRRYLILDTIENADQSPWDFKKAGVRISRNVQELAKESKKPLYEKSFGEASVMSISSIYLRDKTPEDEALRQQVEIEGQKRIKALTPHVEIPAFSLDDVKAVIQELEAKLK